MPRQINYNILLNFPQGNGNATGRFQDKSRNARVDDNSRTWNRFDTTLNPPWFPMPVLLGQREDSVVLLNSDSIAIAFGEKRLVTRQNPNPPRQVANIQVAATISRALDRQPTEATASPFGPRNNPTTLFLGSAPGGSGSSTMDFAGPFSITDNDNSNWIVEFYVLQLGAVTEVVSNVNTPSRYTIMLGAIVQTTGGQTFSFGHDPEVDVGTDQ